MWPKILRRLVAVLGEIWYILDLQLENVAVLKPQILEPGCYWTLHAVSLFPLYAATSVEDAVQEICRSIAQLIFSGVRVFGFLLF